MESVFYGSRLPTAISSLSTDISQPVDDVSSWMRSNRLQLNAEKTEVMWYVRQLAGSRNFLAVPSRSLVLPLNQSALSVTWASTSTATSAPRPMYAEPCHAVSLHCDNLDIYVDTSPTTAFVLSLSRLSTPGSTTATSCLSGFLSIPPTTPTGRTQCCSTSVFRLRRYDHVTDALAILHYCVCRNELISSWR